MGLTHSNEFYGGLMGFYGGLTGLLELTSCFHWPKRCILKSTMEIHFSPGRSVALNSTGGRAKNAVIGRDSFQVRDRKTYGKAA